MELVAAIIDAQESERARVARDLHDEVGQALTAVLLALRILEDEIRAQGEPDLPVQQLEVARTAVTLALRTVRDLAFDLRPTVLDDLGLVPALDRLVREVRSRCSLRVEFTSDGLDERERIGRPIETVLYRVAQEALTNVVRHAQATIVEVWIGRRGHVLRLTVRDDGRGFCVETAGRDSLGIRGMHERAMLAGGTLRIESSAHGTTVELEVPLD